MNTKRIEDRKSMIEDSDIRARRFSIFDSPSSILFVFNHG